MDAQRRSFFRRSLSSRSATHDEPLNFTDVSGRRTAGNGSAGGLVAGPAYVSPQRTERYEKLATSTSRPNPQDDANLTPIAASFRQVSLTEIPAGKTSLSSASPGASSPQARGPIHPALASPPRSYNHLAGREGPYPEGRRKSVLPKDAPTNDSGEKGRKYVRDMGNESPSDRHSRITRTPDQVTDKGYGAQSGSGMVSGHRPTLTVQTLQPTRRPAPVAHVAQPQVEAMLGLPATPEKPIHPITPSPRPSPGDPKTPNKSPSEASAYAREVTSRLQSQHRLSQSDALLPNTRRSSRPLPQPPRSLSATITTSSSPAPVSPPALDVVSRTSPARTPTRNGIAGAEFTAFSRDKENFQEPSSRSPLSKSVQNDRARPSSEARPIVSASTQASPQTRTNMGIPLTGSPKIEHRSASRQHNAPNQSTPPRNPPRAHQSPRVDRKAHPFAYLLSYPMIQSALLSHLNINTFLALMGSSERLRKQFTGEAVGKWVLSEWGMRLGKERGRSWPNLTVWEGFLESMLHDVATYSTYSPHWHNLLRHLSLSHTLIVLHLRTFPNAAFPTPAPLPFEEDLVSPSSPLQFSPSIASLSGMSPSPFSRSRRGSLAGSEVASIVGSRPPRSESLMEIVMPEPLAPSTGIDTGFDQNVQGNEKLRRKSSISSLASAASLSFGRRRSNSASVASARPASALSVSSATIALPAGKAGLPPVSFPAAKRYGFKRHVESGSARSRTSSDSGRPLSIFTNGSSPSIANQSRLSSTFHPRNAPPLPELPFGFGNGVPRRDVRSSVSSSDHGRSSRRADYSIMRSSRIEPAFDQPIPFVPGRAPLLRVFVPLSNHVRRWPSAEGAAAAMRELDKCGASRRLRLGDLVINTAIARPRSTEHILFFDPSNKHLLIPLEYTLNPCGHLPASVDAFALPPSYYHSFFTDPQVLFLNLAPFANQAYHSIRLAFDRRDVVTASGARVSAKRYLYVAGFQIESTAAVSPSWAGMVSLETEGTAEGRKELERRLGDGDPRRVTSGPWEVVAEKSLQGSIWLRILRNR